MFRALNSVSDEDDSKYTSTDDSGSEDSDSSTSNAAETRETEANETYQKALKYFSVSKFNEAKVLLDQLANDEIFNKTYKAHFLSNADLRQLHFAIFKNLAAIHAEQQNRQLSIECYLKAINICDSDVTVLYRLGIEASKVEDFLLAREAFEKGLEISPEHWMCTDKLIAVLFIVHDYPNCLMRISTALKKNSEYVRGLILSDEIFRRSSYLKPKFGPHFVDYPSQGLYSEEDASELINRLDVFADRFYDAGRPKSPPLAKPKTKLNQFDWTSLGEALCTLYDELLSEKKVLSTRMDFSDWLIRKQENEMDCEILTTNAVDGDTREHGSVVFSEQAFVEIPELSFCTDSNLITQIVDSSLDVSESDNESKSAAAVSGADDNQSASLVSDQECSSKSAKLSSRGRKRKSLVAQLSEAKRRSARLIPGFYMEDPEAFGPLTTKTISLKDQLNSFLPDKLISVAHEELSEAPVDEDARLSMDYHSKMNFQTLNEGFDLEMVEFLEGMKICCYLNVLTAYVRRFCGLWRKKWSDKMLRVFLDCYKRWAKHVQFTLPVGSESFEWLIDVAFARLFALEIELRFTPQDVQRETSETVEHVWKMAAFRETLGEEWASFVLRVCFYRARRAEMCKKLELAKFFNEQAAILLKEHFASDNCSLFVPNLECVISLTSVEKKLDALEKKCLLNSVESCFENGDYSTVVDVLATKNDGTLKEQFERSCLLTKSYSCLRRFNEMAPCVVEAFRLCLEVYRRLDFCEKGHWFAKFDEVLSWIETCDAETTLFAHLTSQMQKTFAETLIEVVLCVLDYGEQRQKEIPNRCWLNPWILLYKLCKISEAQSLDDDVYIKSWYATGASHNIVLTTKSLMILYKAHEELGKKGLCMLNDGQLLLVVAEELLNSLRHPIVAKHLTSSVNDDTLNCAEQCFYCLYNYPRKRSRCLVEHESKNISLTWERAQLLFDFVRPEKAPEFDDMQHNCISGETVHLLDRIEKLIPVDLKPEQFLNDFDDYIEERSNTWSINSARLADEQIVRDLYYLVADFYGKAKEKDLHRVSRYYTLDLCVSPDRADSWAGLALHKAAILCLTLNSLDLKHDEDGFTFVETLAAPALFCFRKALSMFDGRIGLMVEHAEFAYSLYSYVSRILKRRGSAMKNDADRLKYKNQSIVYLTEARSSLEKAILLKSTNDDESKEEWVRYYMLGKVAEKFDDPPHAVLRLYHWAAYCLNEAGAKYPTRMQYNVGHLAFEAVEIFYRMHAAALKWLKRGRLGDNGELETVLMYLRMYCDSPFKNNEQQQRRFSSNLTEKRVKSVRIFTNPDVVDVLDDVLDKIDPKTGLDSSDYRRNSVAELIKLCGDAMQIIIKRCSHISHYKAYYWLARIYFDFPETKDIRKSRGVLIGISHLHIPPLFQNLKGQNLFEGVWMIPPDDVSRAGSMASHLYRTVRFLERILHLLGDFERLCDVSWLLFRIPGSEKSKYLNEHDRCWLASFLMKSATNTIKEKYQKVTSDRQKQLDVCIYAYEQFRQDVQRINSNKWYQNHWNVLIKWLYCELTKSDDSSPELMVMALNFFQNLSTKRHMDKMVLDALGSGLATFGTTTTLPRTLRAADSSSAVAEGTNARKCFPVQRSAAKEPAVIVVDHSLNKETPPPQYAKKSSEVAKSPAEVAKRLTEVVKRSIEVGKRPAEVITINETSMSGDDIEVVKVVGEPSCRPKTVDKNRKPSGMSFTVDQARKKMAASSPSYSAWNKLAAECKSSSSTKKPPQNGGQSSVQKVGQSSMKTPSHSSSNKPQQSSPQKVGQSSPPNTVRSMIMAQRAFGHLLNEPMSKDTFNELMNYTNVLSPVSQKGMLSVLLSSMDTQHQTNEIVRIQQTNHFQVPNTVASMSPEIFKKAYEEYVKNYQSVQFTAPNFQNFLAAASAANYPHEMVQPPAHRTLGTASGYISAGVATSGSDKTRRLPAPAARQSEQAEDLRTTTSKRQQVAKKSISHL